MSDVMDPQPKQPKKSDLLIRSLSSIVLGPPVLAAVYFGSPYSDGLIVLCALILSWEWAMLTGRRHIRVPGWLLVASVTTLLVLGALGFEELFIPVLLLCTVLIFAYTKFIERDVPQAFWLTLGLGYVSVTTYSLLWLRNGSDNGFEIVLWILLVVWSTDIGAYFSGKSIGGPKIAPSISPKKTWAGLIGGMIAAAAISFGFAISTELFSPILLGFFGACLAVVSQMGDFFESHIKRKFDAKDSSNLIPGHGGLFDRVDGLLACSLLVFLIHLVY
ncbi:phosphatidate cytidylyltransferase [uncultured Kiloniella sp.]|uniref:phosphatidate cytidylyltransferase n=1 Tax=uncultured Kiloniella sp. TaxID=1133091 RepID=UPI0026110A96|nr:phosphatidate cytidylyltransferase [uncultured Kiloniella sp.]